MATAARADSRPGTPRAADSLRRVSSPRLRKEFGQHHLLHGEICRPLIEFLRPAERRTLEIGPGGGILTGQLLAAKARVVAWEIDLPWAFALRRALPSNDLEIVAGDGLDIPWERLRPALVTGNLPYNVATPLIERALRAPGVERAAFLVQLEVAERLVAQPGDSEYGALSVLTRAWAEPRWLGRVRRGSFRPPPKVDGAFVGFELHPPPLPLHEMSAFTRLVRLAFGQRRKTLRNALGAGWGPQAAEAVLEALAWPQKVRAETRSLEDFLALYRMARERIAGLGDSPTPAAPDESGSRAS